MTATRPIDPAGAWTLIVMAARSGREPSFHLTGFQREGLEAIADGRPLDDIIRETAREGDARDVRIAQLEGALAFADAALSAWLGDNTEEAFEEEPEIDGIRSVLSDVSDGRIGTA